MSNKWDADYDDPWLDAVYNQANKPWYHVTKKSVNNLSIVLARFITQEPKKFKNTNNIRYIKRKVEVK